MPAILPNVLICHQCRCSEKPELAYYWSLCLEHEDRRHAHYYREDECIGIEIFKYHVQVKHGTWLAQIALKTALAGPGEKPRWMNAAGGRVFVTVIQTSQSSPPQRENVTLYVPLRLWRYSLNLGINSYDSRLAVYCHAITPARSFLHSDTQLNPPRSHLEHINSHSERSATANTN